MCVCVDKVSIKFDFYLFVFFLYASLFRFALIATHKSQQRQTRNIYRQKQKKRKGFVRKMKFWKDREFII